MFTRTSNRTARVTTRIGLLLALALMPAESGAEETRSITIAGKVLGWSGSHTLRLALWRADHFLEKPFQTVSIPAGHPAEFSFSASPGEWAVSAYEDVNENGTLDMGLFGPKEPMGFWRPFTAHRKPTFKDVSMVVERDLTNVEIRLK